MVELPPKLTAQVCKALLRRIGCDDYWSSAGPSRVARNIRDGQVVASGDEEFLLLMLAFDLHDGTGEAKAYDLLTSLDPPELAAVGSLLVALSEGPDAVGRWLQAQRVRHG